MTLTELSYYVRKYYPFVILGLLLFLILYYSIQLTIIIIQSRNKNIFTDPVFGKIHAPIISEASSSGDIKYTLDTIEGKPVTATESAKVYFLPPSATKFGYRERLYLFAKSFGFSATSKYTLVDNQAVFEDDVQKLVIDVTNFNFTYDYKFEGKDDIFETAVMPQTDESQSKATEFLQSIGKYPDELTRGKVVSQFLNYDVEKQSFVPLTRNLNSNAVEVNFYRPELEGAQVVSPKYPQSHNYVLMVFYPESGYKILRAQMRFYPKSDEHVGVYPLRRGDEVLNDLKAGGGVLLSNPQQLREVTVKKMFLAYFDSNEYQDYLQPIYVFLGDDNFAAIVPAISKDYLTK